MSIGRFIQKWCHTPCIYWGNPQEDGYGSYTFDDPEDIMCRWEESTQLIIDQNGDKVVSRAVIYLSQPLQYNGLVKLGSVEDLDSVEAADPSLLEDAYTIKRVEKIPDLRNPSVFLYRVSLSPWYIR